MNNKSKVSVIAGPCSIDTNNIKDIYNITNIRVLKRRAIAGVRIVGLKSRTILDEKAFCGIDFETYKKNQELLLTGKSIDDFYIPPSVKIAEKIQKDTNVVIASEIMSPILQIPPYVKKLPQNKLLLWSPSVNQLGWTILETAQFCKLYGWFVGIKNGKWVGDDHTIVDSHTYNKKSSIEKTWEGLVTYADSVTRNVILIHRGVDVPNKGDYRNLPVHIIARRTKLSTKKKLFFDPSHSCGPKMRNKIIDITVEAMRIKINKVDYLYDGVLIEVGNSQSDTDQHVSIAELEKLVNAISEFRGLLSPDENLL